MSCHVVDRHCSSGQKIFRATPLVLLLVLLGTVSSCDRPPSAGLEAEVTSPVLVDFAARLISIESPRFIDGETDPESFEAGYREEAEAYARLTLEDLLAASGTPGLSVAIWTDFDTIWTQEWGVSDLETERPVDEERSFRQLRFPNQSRPLPFSKGSNVACSASTVRSTRVSSAGSCPRAGTLRTSR